MGITTTQQYVSEDPRFVAYKEGLLQDSSDFVRGQMGYNQVPVTDASGNAVLDEQGQPTYQLQPIVDPETGQPIGPNYAPDQQVAGLSAPEQEAIALAQQGVGAYQPFIQRGYDATEAGLQQLEGAAQQFDPSTISNFMNPYQDQAIDYAMQDIQRVGDVQQQGASRWSGSFWWQSFRHFTKRSWSKHNGSTSADRGSNETGRVSGRC